MIKLKNYELNIEKYFILLSFVFFNIFILSWNYSYLPLTEGWFLLAGKFIEEGYLPYNDFYAYLTPFYYWYSFFILKLGEETIFISRILGQLNLNILFFLTYKILNINFPKSQSIVSALFAMIFYLSINAILSYDFIHITNIFAFISYYLIVTKKDNKYLFFAGLFAAMCFLTKQSNGAVIFFTLFIIFIYKFKNSMNLIIYPFMGSLTAVVINFFPFLTIEGLKIVMDNIIINAGGAKGGIAHSLTTLIPPKSDFYSLEKLLKFILKILLPLMVILKFHYLFGKKTDNLFTFKEIHNISFTKNHFLIFIIISIILIIFYFFKIQDIYLLNHITDFFFNRIYLWSGYCPIIFILFYKNKNFDKTLGILLLGLTFAAATSAGLTTVSIFLHVAFLICLLLSLKTFYNFGLILAFSVIFSYSSIAIIEKNIKTYHWWGVNSYKGNYESYKIQFISKIKNDGIGKNLENINNALSKCKNKPSNLIAFPHGALINLTTNIKPPTPTVSYWFDFLSNRDAEIELKKLKQKKLDIIVIIEVDELAWKTHEALFRPEDKYLAQRKIYQYLRENTDSPNYSKIYDFYQDRTKVEVFSNKELLCN